MCILKAELKDLEKLLQDHDIAHLAILKICESNNFDLSGRQKLWKRSCDFYTSLAYTWTYSYFVGFCKNSQLKLILYAE